jgi:hypothetical protein
MFTAEHEAFWSAARRAHGDGDGTRELVEVLLLHRHLPDRDVIEGLAAATAVGAVRADVVAVEARRIADTRPRTPDIDHIPNDPVGSSRVVSLTERRLSDPAAVIAGLPLDQRPLPTVNAYDELLGRRKRAAPQAEQPGRVRCHEPARAAPARDDRTGSRRGGRSSVSVVAVADPAGPLRRDRGRRRT